MPNQAGFITNVAEVFGDGAEAYLANNRATTVTRVNFATLSLDSVTVAEGNTIGVTVDLPVRLTPANNLEVRCDCTTTNNTAQAGSDYVPVAGTLVFPPGVTNQTIRIPILSDDLNEAVETVLVTLFNPVRCILLQSSVGCVILDDDPVPVLTIGDAAVQEGPEESTTNALFAVNLSHPSGQQVTVDYATVEGRASPGKDYIPVSGTLIIPVGVTNNDLNISAQQMEEHIHSLNRDAEILLAEIQKFKI